MMKDTSGRSLPLPSMRFDLDSLSWRTCEATSLWDLEMSSPSFPEWGMTVNGELFELPTPERPTVAHVSSSLPTPTAADGTKMSSNPETSARRMEKGKQASLTDIVQTEMLPAGYLLPTPRAQNGEERNQNIWARPLDQPQNLENALALLPTPTVMDMGSNYTPEEWEAWKSKQKEAHRNGNGHGASLTQEALSIGASTQGQFFDGSEYSDDQPQIQLSPE